MPCCRCDTGDCRDCQCVKRRHACTSCKPSSKGACKNPFCPLTLPPSPSSENSLSPARQTSETFLPSPPTQKQPPSPSATPHSPTLTTHPATPTPENPRGFGRLLSRIFHWHQQEPPASPSPPGLSSLLPTMDPTSSATPDRLPSQPSVALDRLPSLPNTPDHSVGSERWSACPSESDSIFLVHNIFRETSSVGSSLTPPSRNLSAGSFSQPCASIRTSVSSPLIINDFARERSQDIDVPCPERDLSPMEESAQTPLQDRAPFPATPEMVQNSSSPTTDSSSRLYGFTPGEKVWDKKHPTEPFVRCESHHFPLKPPLGQILQRPLLGERRKPKKNNP